MHKAWLLTALLATIALAGCLDGETDGTDGNNDGTSSMYGIPDCESGYVDDDGVNVVAPTDDVLPIDADGLPLDRWDFELTNYRSCTMEKVGHSALRFLEDGTPNPHDYLGELDMRGDLDLGAIQVNGAGEDPAVYLVDISDRANPAVLSRIDIAANYVVDVKISDDGDFLFTASQYLGTSGTPTQDSPVPTGPSAPLGFTIWDISDRANPAFVQTVPAMQGLGCHMLSHEVIDGTDVVFCVSQQIEAHGFIRAADGLPWVYLTKFVYGLPDGSGATSDAPVGCVNEITGTGTPADAAADALLCNGPHDMTVQVDDVDGRVLMSASHWDEGLRIVDVSAPVTDGFVTLARWTGEGAKHYDGNVHSAMTFWVGEKRYAMATPEMTYGGVVPAVWILDATDLGDGSSIIDLELVAEWYHPREFPTPGLLMTTHQWQVGPVGTDVDASEVNMYITMNHLGVWVLDFEAMLAGDLQGAIGGFHMAREPLDQDTDVGNAPLATWDVNVVDGYIYGSDRATGLWVFDYTGDAEGDERINGFA